MKCNVGRIDQIARIVIGTGIVISGLYFRKSWGFIGLIPIATGTIRYCPISDALGISTCNSKK